MPEEVMTQQLEASIPNDVKVAPNLESELDAALSKNFPNITSAPQANEKEPPKQELKEDSKDVKKSSEKPEPSVEKGKSKLPPTDDKDSVPEKMSEQNKDGWSVLKTNYKKAQRLAEEREQEITKLKEVLAEKGNLTNKEVESLKSQIQDLSKYRAMIDIQADPEFISKYDQPIEKSVSSIKEMLLGMNVSEGIVNQIDFSNTKLMDQIIGHVGEHQDKFIARKLQRKVEDLIDLSDKRDETLTQQREKYQEFLESKKKENFSKEAEGEGRIYKHLDNIAQGKDREGNQKYPPIAFLNKMTPNEGATQPEIDQVENHNQMVDLMGKKVQEAIKMNSPEEKAELAVAAVASHYLGAQLKAAQGKIQSLEQELKKISSVNEETIKAKVNSPKRNSNGLDVDSALSSHFSSIR